VTATEPTRDCPACEAGIAHDEHCPTPETHNWGCGCPADEHPAAGDRSPEMPSAGTLAGPADRP
jgi:hypothetical protein